MKLKGKIKPHYLEQILRGEKPVDYRQIESIILVNEADGSEYEFKVEGIEEVKPKWLKQWQSDIDWKNGLVTVGILLGKRIR